MRAAAILGLGCSLRSLRPFQTGKAVEWRIGVPASRDDADVILVIGGDGTIHRHLANLVRLGLPVLVVPAGSGNDFARSLRIRGLPDSISAWKKFCSNDANVRSIDLGVIASPDKNDAPNSPTYFCCVAGLGLDSEVTRRANRLPRWLRANGGYVLSFLRTILGFSPVLIKILTPDENQNWTIRSDQPTMLAVVANAPLYGGGMKIAPLAKMDDGLLDICVVARMSPLRLFWMFPAVYGGRHLHIREVSYAQAKYARIETEHLMDVYADGEFVCQTPVEVGVERAALRVITP